MTVLQEPVAAAVAFNFLDDEASKASAFTALTTDYGGGKLSVSVAKKEDGTLDV